METQINRDHCENCGAQLQGVYCHQCGQKDKEFRLSFFKLVGNFIAELTFFDNKIWRSITHLCYHPAKMTREFLSGKRKKFVPPIRMYLFLSSLFLVFSISSDDWNFSNKESETSIKVQTKNDSILTPSITSYALQKLDSINQADPKYKNSWSITKGRQLINRYQSNPEGFFKDLRTEFNDKFPYFLYLSLPLIAFLLWLLYIRKTNYLFVDHLIFTIVLFSGHFLYLLLGSFFELIISPFAEEPVNLQSWIAIILLIYTFIAIHRFYRQTFFKTLFKYTLLLIVGGLFMILILIGLVLLSVISIS